MERQTIHLQGLNYLASDKDAPAGACRILTNLHPYGKPQSPRWRAVNGPSVFMSGEFFSPYIYHRANLPTVMICGNLGDNGYQQIVTLPINFDGTLASTTPTVLKNLGTVHGNRHFRYAQVGDTLIISVIDNETPKELYSVFVDGSETVIFPFNLPQAPMLTPSETISPLETGLNSGWYGFRWGLVLHDGTIARPSPVRMFEIANEATAMKFDVATVSGKGVDWRKVVRGLGLFVSARGASIEDVLKNQPFYHVHTYERIFDATEDDTFTLYKTDEQIKIMPLMPEDNLMVHTLSAGEVFSYNKALILGDMRYNFVKPSKITFASAELSQEYPAVDNVIAKIDRIGNSDQTYSFRLSLSWRNPIHNKFIGVVIVNKKRVMSLKAIMDLPFGFPDYEMHYAPYEHKERGSQALPLLAKSSNTLTRMLTSFDEKNTVLSETVGIYSAWTNIQSMTVDFLCGHDWDGAAPDLNKFGDNGPWKTYTYEMTHWIDIIAMYSDGHENPVEKQAYRVGQHGEVS